MALLLNACDGSRILIGEGLVLEVTRTGGSIRLAFHVPAVRVIREEIATDEELLRTREITGTGPPLSASINSS